MKKLALFLACVLLSMTLCSCTIESIADSGSDQGSQTQPTQTTEQNPPAVTNDTGEHTIHEDEDFAITVTSIEYDDTANVCTINLKYENHSDKELDFYCGDVTVNGWTSTSSWFSCIDSGESCVEEIVLGSGTMNGHIITSADRVSFLMEVCDAYNYSADPLLNEVFTLYPSGLTDDEIVIPERNHTPNEMVVVDDDDISFVVMDASMNDTLGTAGFIFYIANRTNEYLEFTLIDTSINRWAIDPHCFLTVAPGSRFYAYVTLDHDVLNLCGIEQIDQFTAELQVYSRDDIDGYYFSEIFSMFPTGCSPEDIPSPERVPIEGENVILDSDGLTVILDPLRTDGDSVFMNLYIRNSTGMPLYITMDNFTANGTDEFYQYVVEYIPVAGSFYYPVECTEYDLYEIDFEDIEYIDCTLEIMELDMYEIIFNEHIISSF